MNCSENNKMYGRKIVRSRVQKRQSYKKGLFASWGFCFLVGFLMGCLLIFGIRATGSQSEPVKTEAVHEVIDNRTFTEEMSMDWSSGAEVGFVPLDVPMDEEMQEFIHCLSYGYNIDFPFVMALIETESQFDVDVISDTNDYGLMQINKINHRWLTETLGVTNYLNPHENVRAGLFMLRQLFEKYEHPSKVLMAYNLGEGGAKRLWDNGVYETEYSKKIIEKSLEYETQISERKGASND